MTKVYFMQDYDLHDLEKRVNEFIADKEVWDIMYNTLHMKTPKNFPDIVHSVMIRYEVEEQPTSFWEDAMFVMKDMTIAQAKEAIKYLTERVETNDLQRKDGY